MDLFQGRVLLTNPSDGLVQGSLKARVVQSPSYGHILGFRESVWSHQCQVKLVKEQSFGHNRSLPELLQI
jgi:hypothetical protein